MNVIEHVDNYDEMNIDDNEMKSSSDIIITKVDNYDNSDDNNDYMVEKEVLSYPRIKADLKASRRLKKKNQAKIKTIKAWSTLSSSSSSSQQASVLSLPLSIIQRNSWTILTDLSVLKSNGYRGQYYRKKLKLPLPIKFRTPRYTKIM